MSLWYSRPLACLLAAAFSMLGVLSEPGCAKAAEGGVGTYLLGFRSSMSGIVPPPGVYVQSDTFYYQGSAQAESSFSRGVSRRNVNFEIAGVPVAGVEAESLIEIGTGTWIAKPKILGGIFGLAYTQGVGWLEVGANVGISGTGELEIGPAQISRTRSFARTAARTDDTTGLADPYFTALIGWHAGNLHWNLNAGLNVPAGDWEFGRLANLGFNR